MQLLICKYFQKLLFPTKLNRSNNLLYDRNTPSSNKSPIVHKPLECHCSQYTGFFPTQTEELCHSDEYLCRVSANLNILWTLVQTSLECKMIGFVILEVFWDSVSIGLKGEHTSFSIPIQVAVPSVACQYLAILAISKAG